MPALAPALSPLLPWCSAGISVAASPDGVAAGTAGVGVLAGGSNSSAVTLKQTIWAVKTAASTNVMSAHAKKDSFLLLSLAQYSSWMVALEPGAVALGSLGTE
jgi:hypothetical protein